MNDLVVSHIDCGFFFGAFISHVVDSSSFSKETPFVIPVKHAEGNVLASVLVVFYAKRQLYFTSGQLSITEELNFVFLSYL